MSARTNPSLAAARDDLLRLARNLRWSWHPPTQELFARLDPVRWEAVRRNPVRLLAEIEPERLEHHLWDPDFLAGLAEAVDDLHRYLAEPGIWFTREHGAGRPARIAYFSAEFAIAECLPIFSGGLGVLAGDHLKSASDLGVPLVGVGLLYREGYFTQEVTRDGRQRESYPRVDPRRLPLARESRPDGSPLVVSMPFLDHQLRAAVWRADVGRIPLYLLDTELDANRPEDRRITDRLYGGDLEHRLRQEIVLGIGGMRALRALGRAPDVVHLNEGHAAFAAMERARQVVGEEGGALDAAAGELASGVVFTTHTPVPAGHDSFPADLLERYLGGYVWEMREPWTKFLELGRRTPADGLEPFCMTVFALRLSARRNGVSRLHGAVSRTMWRDLWPDTPEDEVPIGHITNGIHLPTWVGPAVADLYDARLGPDWSHLPDGRAFSGADALPAEELWAARGAQRRTLVARVRRAMAERARRRGEDDAWTADALDPDALTIVFARRFATYKRATLLLSDPPRLLRLLAGPRPVQFVFAGKAHPRDEPGKELLRQVATFAAHPEVRRRFVFLEDYDVGLARDLVQGADVWLNVPIRPHEASGTSGMKAAANGALNLSVPDGWWAEAWEERNGLPAPIGWSVEPPPGSAGGDRAEAETLYRLLEDDVVPLFYERDGRGLPVAWLERVRASLRQAVPYFTTHRMVRDYVERLYLPAARGARSRRAGEAAAAAV